MRALRWCARSSWKSGGMTIDTRERPERISSRPRAASLVTVVMSKGAVRSDARLAVVRAIVVEVGRDDDRHARATRADLLAAACRVARDRGDVKGRGPI